MDTGSYYLWTKLLLDVIQSPAKIRHLSHWYWEWLVNLVASYSSELASKAAYNPHTIASLEGSREWDKLKCWLCTVWMIWPPEDDWMAEENLEQVMLSLSYQQPGAIQELERQLEEWGGASIPRSFQQICKKIYSEISQQARL